MNNENLKSEKLINKIKKLLALSSSPNESESAAALLKATELLAKNELRIEDIRDECSIIKENVLDVVSIIKPWEEKLISCITKATFTEVLVLHIKSYEHLRIIGRESNVITAKVLYEYLQETIRRKAKLFHECIDDVESFSLGMVESIKGKFEQRLAKEKEKVANKKQIVIIEKGSKKENMDYVKRKYGKTNERDNWYGVDENSYGLGKSIGKKISIDGQLSSE
ncbi:DUF2786 domain-containing protein [Marispirochaeta aestuarii]|uniref:DUF2786 domain-containing protein n=1 Tax=Marispirochaeta aestuarii TaxID=1963862 RepID=UPI0029C6CF11|nr:DUF2786 domain-containing protein [Marispirochaeta aestuarii]